MPEDRDSRVHLRLCRMCGHVDCCDDPKYKHAAKLSHRTEHPIVTSPKPGESWMWSYPDKLLIE